MLWVAMTACGGSTKPPEEPAMEPAAEEPVEEPAPPPEPVEEEPAPEPVAAEPEFRPGMSVLEATNAVPSSAERINLEQERLAAPLMKAELYEPCKLASHKHFQLHVAVWDGRAVGVDVTTKPKDPKLEECLRQQISTIEWEDKAKSLNAVEYSF